MASPVETNSSVDDDDDNNSQRINAHEMPPTVDRLLQQARRRVHNPRAQVVQTKIGSIKENDRKFFPFSITTSSLLRKSQMPSGSCQTPRLVERNLPFDQSRNILQVKYMHFERKLRGLLKHDWFHILLSLPTAASVSLLLITWTIWVLIFAVIYMVRDRILSEDSKPQCLIGPSQDAPFGAYFAFSLETATTVGYGFPNNNNEFFTEKCSWVDFLLYCNMLSSMFLNAFIFAFMFSRLSRSDNRGTQVIMSNKAIVSIQDGQLRLQMRVYDLDAKLPVVEAHVRLYAVARERPVPRPIRTLQPNDDFGGMLFLSFPFVISHHIDLYSLLHHESADATLLHYPSPNTLTRRRSRTALGTSRSVDPSGLLLRQADSAVGLRSDVICPVCGESYGTVERWLCHVRFQKIVEENDGYGKEGTHLALKNPIEHFSRSRRRLKRDGDPIREQGEETLEKVREYFQKEISEIICVVEGIE